MGDKCGRQVGGDKLETSVNSCGPRHRRVKDKCGEARGDKCKLMRPKESRVRDKYGRHVWETSVTHAAQGTQSRRQGGDRCKFMRPKAPRVGDKYARQAWETSVNSGVNSCGQRHPE